MTDTLTHPVLSFIIPHAGDLEPLIGTVDSLLLFDNHFFFDIFIVTNTFNDVKDLFSSDQYSFLKVHVFQELSPPSIYGAMNYGASLSNADYLHFLNCGDVVTPSFVSVLNELSDHSKPYCVHAYPSLQYYNSYRKSRVFLPPKSKFSSLVTNTWAHSSLIYPSSLFKITQYDIKYSCAADYDLTLSALFNLGYKYISHPTHNCIVLMAPLDLVILPKRVYPQLRLVRNKFILPTSSGFRISSFPTLNLNRLHP